MKSLIAVLGIIFLAGTVSAEDVSVLKTENERISYSIGLDIGKNFKSQSINIDSGSFSQGIQDGLKGNKALMTDQEIKDTMANFQKKMMAKQTTRSKELGAENKKKGEAFLAKNEKKKGIITLPSGLQYEIIEEGSGNTPKATDTVSVHYRGTLIDGTEFDSSHKRGQPATFNVGGVIKGWTEALQLMKEGAKWQLFIPSKLAYGERGAGRSIGPDETLIFEVELLSINKGH